MAMVVRSVLVALILAAIQPLPVSANAQPLEPAARDLTEGQGKRVHTVQSGQSLWVIARSHGCMPTDIQVANGLIDTTIHPGQDLIVPDCAVGPMQGPQPLPAALAPAVPPGESASAPTPKEKLGAILNYRIRSGDSLYKIARRHKTSVLDIRMRNGLDGNAIFPGQSIELLPGSGSSSGHPIPGQSIGLPYGGSLRHASKLANSRAYFIRRAKRTFGAHHVVHHVRRIATFVKRKHPRLHKLAIGDISARKGGKISGHNSHQSGRDVDFGLYYKKRPKAYPKEFVEATKRNFNAAATWTLVKALAATAEMPGGVERMFLGYRTQKLLYKWAKKKGVAKEKLRRLFQYPYGEDARHGLIRHEPYHDDHVHVRFKCPPKDKSCDS